MNQVGDVLRRWRPVAIPLAFLLLSALVYHFPRLFLDLFFFNYDTQIHFLSSLDFVRALGEGQLLPRWLGRGNEGLGAPVFVMYSPFFFYLVAIADLVTADVWLAIKLVNLLTCWAVGGIAYLLFRRIGLPQYGLFAGVCLQFAPAFVVYLFTTMFTYTNLVFALLFVLCFVAYDERKRYIDLRVGVVTFFMIFTHVISGATVLFSFFIGAAAAGLILRHDIAGDARRVIGFGLSSLLGIGLAMVHIMPGIFSTPFVEPRHFPNNIGLSMLLPLQADPADIRWVTAQWTVPLILLAINLVSTAVLFATRSDRDGRYRFAALCLAGAWVSLIIGSPLALPLWEVFVPLNILQFGHRFNFSFTLFTLLASVAALAVVQAGRPWSWIGRALVLPGVLSCAAGALLLTKYTFVDAQPSPFLLSDGYTVKGPPDFQPINAKPARNDYLARGGFAAECRALDIECSTTRRHVHDLRWTIDAASRARLRLPVLYFPGWAVTVGNKAVAISPDPETGLISVAVPEGRSYIRLYWSYADYERVGIALSWAVLMLMLIVFGFRRRAAGPPADGNA